MGNFSYCKELELYPCSLWLHVPRKRIWEDITNWKPPKESWMKLNSHGAFKGNPGLAASKGNPGLACANGLIRDEVGRWRGGFVYYVGVVDSFEC